MTRDLLLRDPESAGHVDQVLRCVPDPLPHVDDHERDPGQDGRQERTGVSEPEHEAQEADAGAAELTANIIRPSRNIGIHFEAVMSELSRQGLV